MPLSLSESPCASSVGAAWMVGSAAASLDRASPPAAAATFLLTTRSNDDAPDAHDLLRATTNGSTGGQWAEAMIAGWFDVVDLTTVTAATGSRILCPGWSRADAGGVAVRSAFSSVRLGGSMGGGTLFVLLVLDGGDVLRRGAEEGVMLLRARPAVGGTGCGAAAGGSTLDMLMTDAPSRTR